MKIRKLLFPLALAGVVTAPLTTLTTSCGSKYSQVVNTIVNKLVEMDKYPRCTSKGERQNLDPIRYWIFKEAEKSGINVKDIVVDTYGNLFFDVEPSKGYEDYEPLILQGHMDMVVEGLSETAKASTPIDVEVEWDKGIVHSKNNLTSIGADDGVSLAIIFTLLQDSSFKHGPLRIMFTADEDSGMLGASFIAQGEKEILTNMGKDFTGAKITHLLNLDGEDGGGIVRSSHGSITYDFQPILNIGADAKFTKTYSLSIDGLLGGHSGDKVYENHASAEKCIYEILYAINTSNPDSIQLVKHYHPHEDKDVSFQRNQIVPYATVIFNSSLSIDKIQKVIDNKIAAWRTIYIGENWNNVPVKITETTVDNKHISAADSSVIIKKLGKNIMPTVYSEENDCIWYGYEKNSEGIPLRTANVSPVTIYYNEATNKFDVDITSQIRCQTNTILDNMRAFYSNIRLFNIRKERSYYPAWFNDGTKPNHMIDLAQEGFKKAGVEPQIMDYTGGVENTWWYYANPDLQLASIGPTIKFAHSIKETLYIDTIQPLVDTVKYVAENMKK